FRPFGQLFLILHAWYGTTVSFQGKHQSQSQSTFCRNFSKYTHLDILLFLNLHFILMFPIDGHLWVGSCPSKPVVRPKIVRTHSNELKRSGSPDLYCANRTPENCHLRSVWKKFRYVLRLCPFEVATDAPRSTI